jgi:hypothetical protein
MPPTGTIGAHVNPLFGTQPLNNTGLNKVDKGRIALTECLKTLMDVCPEGRELSIVKTKLEEAGFYAVKAISLVPGNQDQEAA